MRDEVDPTQSLFSNQAFLKLCANRILCNEYKTGGKCNIAEQLAAGFFISRAPLAKRAASLWGYVCFLRPFLLFHKVVWLGGDEKT